MADFRMPSLGADMEQGVLREWLVKAGDAVHRGDVVAVVETPKAAVEVETFEDGTVQELLVEEGQTVPVGQVLATIAGSTPSATRPRRGRKTTRSPKTGRAGTPTKTGGPPAARSAEPPSTAPVAAPPRLRRVSPVLRHRAHQLGVDLAAVVGTGRGGDLTRADIERGGAAPRTRLRVSPLARRLAAERGVDLATVTGTGTGGGIRAADVHAAAATATTAAGPETRRTEPALAQADSGVTARGMRASIASLMSRSNREIPHYHLSCTVDMHDALTWMRERNRELGMGDRLVPAALMLAATARAARDVPELNGYWEQDGFHPAGEVRMGLIVSLRSGGLLVPAIAEADRLSVVETMRRVRDITQRARTGRLRGSELVTPSITVSNLGDQGAESVMGVIYPPQVALVGFGAISERPWAVDGLLGVRPLVTVTLAGDHRATDGATGSRFLKTVDRFLQRPEEI